MEVLQVENKILGLWDATRVQLNTISADAVHNRFVLQKGRYSEGY